MNLEKETSKYETEEDEDSEVSFSIAHEKLVDDFSEAPTVAKTREKEKLMGSLATDFSKGTLPRKGRPYKVCGGKSKDRKGIVAVSFKELVEKGISFLRNFKKFFCCKKGNSHLT